MEQPHCMKCGGKLKNPESIARGMGPKCTGTYGRNRYVKMHLRQHNGSVYSLKVTGSQQQPMPIGDPPTKRISRSEPIRRKKEERRRLLEAVQLFQCRLLTTTSAPLIYLPLPDD